MLIHKHRDFPSDMFTIMCAVGATIIIGKIENGSLNLRYRKHYPCFYTVIETRACRSLGEREIISGKRDSTTSSSKLLIEFSQTTSSVFVIAGFITNVVAGR
jgi:hypothetical protein